MDSRAPRRPPPVQTPPSPFAYRCHLSNIAFFASLPEFSCPFPPLSVDTVSACSDPRNTLALVITASFTFYDTCSHHTAPLPLLAHHGRGGCILKGGPVVAHEYSRWDHPPSSAFSPTRAPYPPGFHSINRQHSRLIGPEPLKFNIHNQPLVWAITAPGNQGGFLRRRPDPPLLT